MTTLGRLSMRRRLFILHNPNAGPAARRHYHSILTLLRDAGAQAELVETSRHGDGMKVTAEAALSGRFDAIVAAGGDGTVHDAAEGVLGSATPLGIIPMGTANVFAREVGLPFSPEQRCERAALWDGTGHSRRSDQCQALSVCGGHRFRCGGRSPTLKPPAHVNGPARTSFGPVIRALASHSDHLLRVTTNSWQQRSPMGHCHESSALCWRSASEPGCPITRTKFYVVRFGGRGKLVRLRQLSALACGLVRYDPDVIIEPAEWVRVESDAPCLFRLMERSWARCPL